MYRNCIIVFHELNQWQQSSTEGDAGGGGGTNTANNLVQLVNSLSWDSYFQTSDNAAAFYFNALEDVVVGVGGGRYFSFPDAPTLLYRSALNLRT